MLCGGIPWLVLTISSNIVSLFSLASCRFMWAILTAMIRPNAVSNPKINSVCHQQISPILWLKNGLSVGQIVCDLSKKQFPLKQITLHSVDSYKYMKVIQRFLLVYRGISHFSLLLYHEKALHHHFILCHRNYSAT